jgi:hypothetical protein
MTLHAVSRRRWRMATCCALVLAGLVVGSSGIAVVASGSTTTSATRSLRATTGTSPPTPTLRSAGPFFLTVLEQKISGDWAAAWQSLYPPHRRIAPRDAFIRCETATPFPAPLESIHVVRVHAVQFRVLGEPSPKWSAAVTVAVELRWYGPRDPITSTHTFHLVPVDGRWTWLLSPDRYRLYKQHACVAEEAA